MKLPAIMFYPADWKKDPGVQSLNFHDRGVWVELLWLMHESDERGVLLLNGKPMPEEALARVLGLDKQILTTTLTSILDYGVASRRPEDGALYSRRMVRDEKLRKIRTEAGKQGGNPALLKQKPTTLDKQITTTTDKQNPTPSVAVASSFSSSNLKTSTSDSEAVRLAELFLNSIISQKPDFKKPNLKTWGQHIDRMIRIDKRTPVSIEHVIRWVVHDPFWSANVLSARTLREKFDNLELKMHRSGAKGKPTGLRPQRSGDRCEDLGKYDAVPVEDLS